jgi:hypothetical protein
VYSELLHVRVLNDILDVWLHLLHTERNPTVMSRVGAGEAQISEG